MNSSTFQRWAQRLSIAHEARYMEAFADALAPTEGQRVELSCRRAEAINTMRLHRIVPMLAVCDERAHPYRRVTDEAVITTPGIDQYRARVDAIR